MVLVKVKWNKKMMEVEVDVNEGIETLKAQLFTLTNVPMDRQKILMKGKMLKTDDQLLKLKPKQKLMLMGSASALPQAPKEKIVFEEDLTTEEKSALIGIGRSGLKNLGNTCYMNSTLQCLRAVGDLKKPLVKYSQTTMPGMDLRKRVSTSMGDLFRILDSTDHSVPPGLFCQTFRQAFPQFAQRNEHGYMQQDADEALTQMLSTVGSQVRTDSGKSLVDDVFGGKWEVSLKCTESDAEPVKKTVETFTKLKCHIDIETNFLHDGILKGMTEEIEKKSDVLGRNAVFKRTAAISQLPNNLIVQFVRFLWRNDKQTKAKILRRVAYPFKLDIAPYCNDTVKAALSKKREEKLDAETIALGLEPMKKDPPKSTGSGSADMDTSDVPASTTNADEVDKFADSIDHLGYYELIGMVTHIGRSADSGHYIGWVKETSGGWLKFDDDVVTSVTEDEIKKLQGGGDWHIAYICFYRLIRGDAVKKPDAAKSTTADKDVDMSS